MASIDEHVLTAGPGWKPLGFDVLRFARFLTVGGLAAGTNFTSRFAWSLVLPFEAAVICAYATGMALAFVLFRIFDAAKPGPIAWADALCKQKGAAAEDMRWTIAGFGILFDDLVAAFCTLLVLALWRWLW